jgi:hypothetical protein
MSKPVFSNGKVFALVHRCCPPSGENVPFVDVYMSYNRLPFRRVIGKVDTGSFRTLLTYDQARILGVARPESGLAPLKPALTATGEAVPYYVHDVSVQLSLSGSAASMLFPMKLAFAPRIRTNLFGIDWLNHLCLAVDHQAVHFLQG